MTRRRRRLRGRTLGSLWRQPAFTAGVLLLVLLGVLAVSPGLAMSYLWDGRTPIYDPVTGYDPAVLHPAGISGAHWLGTDPLGRDVLSLVMHSLAPTLTVAIVAAVVVATAATALGIAAAFMHGWSDATTGRFVDMMLLLPPPLALIVLGLARPDLLTPVSSGIVYGLLAGLGGAAVVSRAHARTVIVRPFIQAAQVAGAGPLRIARNHLVPHLVPLVGAQMMLSATGAVTTVAFLEFFGTQLGDGSVGLGTLIYYGLTFQRGLGTEIAWSALLSGAVAITALCSAFYLLSVGLREHLAVDQRNTPAR